MLPQKKLLYIGNKLTTQGKPPTSADILPPLLRREGLEVAVVSEKANKWLRLFDMLHTTFKSRKRVHCVLIDTYSTQNFYYALLVGKLCRFYGIPYIPILHGGNLPSRLTSHTRWSKKFFGKAAINIAPSPFMLSEFGKFGFKVEYIPNSIPIADYPFKKRRNIRPKLLWVRSFAEIYNPLLALQVVELLQRKNVEVELCMVGPDKDGSLRHCQTVAAQLKLPVTFTGLLPKKEWIALSSEFDVFVNTTNFDNMPVSVVEAMALGMVVVSTNVGGLENLIEDKVEGILVPPDNPQAFAEAIIDVCNNGEQASAMSIAARKKAERFDWETVKFQWLDILKK